MARVMMSFGHKNNDPKKTLNFDDGFSPLPPWSQNGYKSKNYISAATKSDFWSPSQIFIIFAFVAVTIASRLFYVYFSIDGLWQLIISTYELFPDFRIQKLLHSLAFGISIGVFTWMITYLDSKVPGVNPPTPLSPRNTARYSPGNNNNFFHLNYILSIVLGFTVFVILLWKL